MDAIKEAMIRAEDSGEGVAIVESIRELELNGPVNEMRLRRWANEAQTVMDIQGAEIDNLHDALRTISEAPDGSSLTKLRNIASTALRGQKP